MVSLWDIGQQISLPSYDGVNPQQLLKVISFVVISGQLDRGLMYYSNRLQITQSYNKFSCFLIMAMFTILHGVEPIVGCWPAPQQDSSVGILTTRRLTS